MSMDPSLDVERGATRTTCRFKEDKSNYWTAVLYFEHQNGFYMRVPQMANYFTGGMTVYYIQPPNNQKVTVFPKGFRMIVGDPMLRRSGTIQSGRRRQRSHLQLVISGCGYTAVYGGCANKSLFAYPLWALAPPLSSHSPPLKATTTTTAVSSSPFFSHHQPRASTTNDAHSPCVTRPPSQPPSHLATSSQEMHSIVYGGECVRCQIGEFMDGTSFSCIDFGPDWQMCYACERQYSHLNHIQYTGAALPFAEPSLTLPPLPPARPLRTDALRTRLADRFSIAVEKGQTQAAQAQTSKKSKNLSYQAVLQKVGRSCLSCLIRGKEAIHPGDRCPHIDKNGFNDIVINIIYLRPPKLYKHSPCYKCHVASMGKNTLHKPYSFGTGEVVCDNPNFLNPLFYEVWTNDEFTIAAQSHFDTHWLTLEDYLRWLVTPDPVHSTRPMAMILWFGNYFFTE